jgi:lysophospholipase L1-like esterase
MESRMDMKTNFRSRRPMLMAAVLLLTAELPLVSRLRASAFPEPGDQQIRMVVLGDSVMWGQGLLTKDKHHTLVADMLRSCNSSLTLNRTILAHSGAIIGAGQGNADSFCAGEVNRNFPTILHQLELFDAIASDRHAVNLVLMNGGANDVDLLKVLNPFTPSNEIAEEVEKACFVHMKELLRDTAQKFPNARIVVCGYFQIVSDESNLLELEGALIAYGVIGGGVVGGVPVGVWLGTGLAVQGAFAVAALQPSIAANCRTFADQTRQRLSQAVADVNAELGTRRIAFADPKFGPDEAIFARNAKVFGIAGLSLSFPDPVLTPLDPVAVDRREECDACGDVNTDPKELAICYRASIGHPNERGARKYAEAIFDALTAGGTGLVWADFSVSCVPGVWCGSGHFDDPWGALEFAIVAVPENGTIRIKPSSRQGAVTLASKHYVLEACKGPVTLGH